jgi:hypothetical protein
MSSSSSSSSSYVALPPVWQQWNYEDVHPLTVQELQRLHMIVWKKLEFIEDQIENKALFESRHIDLHKFSNSNNKKKKEIS